MPGTREEGKKVGDQALDSRDELSACVRAPVVFPVR
jgi:hypothetical protein